MSKPKTNKTNKTKTTPKIIRNANFEPGSTANVGRERKYPWDEMKKGDAIPAPRGAASAGTMWAMRRGLGWKFVNRTKDGQTYAMRVK